jgi:hypothetical protein
LHENIDTLQHRNNAAPDLVRGHTLFEPAKDQFCLPGGVELSGNGHTPFVNLRLSRPLS